MAASGCRWCSVVQLHNISSAVLSLGRSNGGQNKHFFAVELTFRGKKKNNKRKPDKTYSSTVGRANFLHSEHLFGIKKNRYRYNRTALFRATQKITHSNEALIFPSFIHQIQLLRSITLMLLKQHLLIKQILIMLCYKKIAWNVPSNT